MILIGYSDLNIRHVLDILEKTFIKLDTKLLNQFNTEKYKQQKLPEEKIEVKINPNNEQIFKRALILSIVCTVFKNKKYFRVEVL